MDPVTQKIILCVVGALVIAGVALYVWHATRAADRAARRLVTPLERSERRKPRRSSDCDCGRDPYDCQCPPHERRRCVPARVTAADPTPVAIYGVRDDDDCCNDGTRRLNRRQVQAMVDRANALALEREQAELDELLLDLRRETKSKAI
jgi:hypothetical protein